MRTQANLPMPCLDHLDPLVSVVVTKRRQLRWSQARLAQAAGIAHIGFVTEPPGAVQHGD